MEKPMLAFAIFVGILSMSGCTFQPYNDSITVDALEIATQSQDYILAKVNDCPDAEFSTFSYYEFSGTTEFSEQLDFENWAISNTAPQGTPSLVLRFAEAWILELYPDGTAWAHNGYAKSGTQSDCYYTFLTDILDSIVAYVEEYATLHTLGDDTISMDTFHH